MRFEPGSIRQSSAANPSTCSCVADAKTEGTIREQYLFPPVPTRYFPHPGFSAKFLKFRLLAGSNPVSPTILSLALPMAYAAVACTTFCAFFGTFGTTEGNSNPKPHRSAHVLRNATSCLILS